MRRSMEEGEEERVHVTVSDNLSRKLLPYLLDYTPLLFASQFGEKEGGAFN